MQCEAFCDGGIPQTPQRRLLGPSSAGAKLHWVSLQTEGGWRCYLKVKVLLVTVALRSLPEDCYCFTVANLNLTAQESLPPFPFPEHHMESLWLRYPIYAQLFPRKALWDSSSPVMVAQIDEESTFFPKTRERIRKVDILASYLSWIPTKLQ